MRLSTMPQSYKPDIHLPPLLFAIAALRLLDPVSHVIRLQFDHAFHRDPISQSANLLSTATTTQSSHNYLAGAGMTNLLVNVVSMSSGIQYRCGKPGLHLSFYLPTSQKPCSWFRSQRVCSALFRNY